MLARGRNTLSDQRGHQGHQEILAFELRLISAHPLQVENEASSVAYLDNIDATQFAFIDLLQRAADKLPVSAKSNTTRAGAATLKLAGAAASACFNPTLIMVLPFCWVTSDSMPFATMASELVAPAAADRHAPYPNIKTEHETDNQPTISGSLFLRLLLRLRALLQLQRSKPLHPVGRMAAGILNQFLDIDPRLGNRRDHAKILSQVIAAPNLMNHVIHLDQRIQCLVLAYNPNHPE